MLWPREGSCLWPWHRGWGTLPSAQSVPAASWRQRQLQLTCTQPHLLPAWGLTHLSNNRRERKGCLAQERKRPHLTAVEGKHGQAGGSSGLSFQPEAPAFAVPVGGWGRRRASGRQGRNVHGAFPAGMEAPVAAPGARGPRRGQGKGSTAWVTSSHSRTGPSRLTRVRSAQPGLSGQSGSPRGSCSAPLWREAGVGGLTLSPQARSPVWGARAAGRGVGLGPVDRRTSGRWDAKLCAALQWGRTVTPGPGFRASRGHHRW